MNTVDLFRFKKNSNTFKLFPIDAEINTMLSNKTKISNQQF